MAVLEKTRDNVKERVFGVMPKRPLHLSVRPLSVNEEYLDGRAVLKELEMLLDFGGKTAALPFTAIIPKCAYPCPAVIEIRGERDIVPQKWMQRGYAVFSIYYKNISDNNGNFKSGISAYIAPTRRKRSSAGKVCVWAWAAIRALEYASDLKEIDRDKISVAGSGIFSLSAILAGESKEGFSFVLSEDTPEIDNYLKTSSPHLFSPEFLKINSF